MDYERYSQRIVRLTHEEREALRLAVQHAIGVWRRATPQLHRRQGIREAFDWLRTMCDSGRHIDQAAKFLVSKAAEFEPSPDPYWPTTTNPTERK
jgi:hypothetical protein